MEMEDGTTGAVASSAASEEEVDDGSVMASWLVVDDETSSELSKLLDLFETPPPPKKVRFIDDPYSTTTVFQSSSAYITINGNEESCGSSFSDSDSDSSVMASIDLCGARRRPGGGWAFDCGEARERWTEGSVGEEADADFLAFLADGCDCSYDGEEAGWVDFPGEMFG